MNTFFLLCQSTVHRQSFPQMDKIQYIDDHIDKRQRNSRHHEDEMLPDHHRHGYKPISLSKLMHNRLHQHRPHQRRDIGDTGVSHNTQVSQPQSRYLFQLELDK